MKNQLTSSQRNKVLDFFNHIGTKSQTDANSELGNCVDYAVGCALGFEQHALPVSVVLILREDDLVPGEELLSHAVVEIDGVCYDGSGDHADTRWMSAFNLIQQHNGDDVVDFYTETYSGDFGVLYDTCQQRFNMNASSSEVRDVVKATTIDLLTHDKTLFCKGEN